MIGCKEYDIVKPLCIILPQMSGQIKYFKNAGKNMSLIIKDDSVLVKCNEVWNKIKTEIKPKILKHACLWWKIHKN